MIYIYQLLSLIIKPAHAAVGFDLIHKVPASIYNPNIKCTDDGSCQISQIISGVGELLKYGVSISGALALLLFIIGGFYWVASAGRKDWIERGKSIMLNTVFAVFFILGAWLIVNSALTILESSIKLEDNSQVVTDVCKLANSDGNECGYQKRCLNSGCVDDCTYLHRDATGGITYACRTAQECGLTDGLKCKDMKGTCDTKITCANLVSGQSRYCCGKSK